MNWSTYQEAILKEAVEGDKHLAVVACPGSGKTTTLIEAGARIDPARSVLFAAFGREIARVLRDRATRGNVKTIHGEGLTTLYRELDQRQEPKVDEDKTFDLVRGVVAPEVVKRLGGESADRIAALVFAVRTAKDVLAGLPLVQRLNARPWRTREELRDFDLSRVSTEEIAPLTDLVARFRIETAPSDPDALHLFGLTVLRLLAGSMRKIDVFDYADMCWLPVARNLAPQTYDDVLVDEWQDLSPSQNALVMRMLKPASRLIAVGDPNQAIYQWRGAHVRAFDDLVSVHGARTMPLPISYRCPRRVVELAWQVNEDIEIAPNAIDGVVRDAPRSEILTGARAGDMILSRYNAPLIALALALHRRKVPSFVLGETIGEELAKFASRFHAPTKEEARAKLMRWWEREVEERAKAKVQRSIADLEDRRSTVLALLDDGASDDLAYRLRQVFRIVRGDKRIVLSSTHQAKGLEADRVWMLEDTYDFDGIESRNLWYVAITRAKKELVLTTQEKR